MSTPTFPLVSAENAEIGTCVQDGSGNQYNIVAIHTTPKKSHKYPTNKNKSAKCVGGRTYNQDDQ